MSTATDTKPLPDHIQNVVDDALNIGWDVVCTPVSVKITPPGGRKKGSAAFGSPRGRKAEQIILSLNPPPAPAQLTVELTGKGFLAAVQAHEREEAAEEAKAEEAKAEEAPKEKAAAPVEADASKHVCPECAAAGEDTSYARPQSLSVHRRMKHGVIGASKEAAEKRAARAQKNAAAEPKAADEPKKASAKAAPKKVLIPAQAQAPAAEEAPQLVGKTEHEISTPVSTALAALTYAVGNATADLQRENRDLRDFRDQVVALASDGTKAPVQVVADILTLSQKTAQP
jgi:hypothetical protein